MVCYDHYDHWQTTPAPTSAPEAGVRGDEAVAGPRSASFIYLFIYLLDQGQHHLLICLFIHWTKVNIIYLFIGHKEMLNTAA